MFYLILLYYFILLLYLEKKILSNLVKTSVYHMVWQYPFYVSAVQLNSILIKGKGRGSQHNKVHHRFWLGTWHTVCQNWVCKQREGFQHGEKLIIQHDSLEISVNSDTVKSAYDNHLVKTLNKVRWISNTIIAISQC